MTDLFEQVMAQVFMDGHRLRWILAEATSTEELDELAALAAQYASPREIALFLATRQDAMAVSRLISVLSKSGAARRQALVEAVDAQEWTEEHRLKKRWFDDAVRPGA